MTRELREYYKDILELDENWTVEKEERNVEIHDLTITVIYTSEDGKYKCPACQRKAVLNNINERTVRHLDIGKYKTWLLVKYPRIKCPLCGIKPIVPPFAVSNSRYTKDFERRIIELCSSYSIQKVAKDMGLHWNVVAGIKDRAIDRGLKRKQERSKTLVAEYQSQDIRSITRLSTKRVSENITSTRLSSGTQIPGVS